MALSREASTYEIVSNLIINWCVKIIPSFICCSRLCLFLTGNMQKTQGKLIITTSGMFSSEWCLFIRTDVREFLPDVLEKRSVICEAIANLLLWAGRAGSSRKQILNARDVIASNADVLSFLKASSPVPSIRNERPSPKNVCRGGYQQLSTLSYLLSSDNCIFVSLCLFAGYNNRRKCEQ